MLKRYTSVVTLIGLYKSRSKSTSSQMLKFILILLRGKNRFIDEVPVLNLVDCKNFCNEKHGKLIDGDLFDELKVTIDDTFFEYDLGIKTCSHTNDAECSFLLNIKFDFEINEWVNCITGTIFEDTRWYNQDNSLPNYPIMNDLLGNDLNN